MTDKIYKILPLEEWNIAKATGRFRGSGIELADGFIHFSNLDQLDETLQKHFAGVDDLVLLAVEPNKLASNLKWEPSRGGDLFPHFYAELPVEDVETVWELPMRADGSHDLPELL